MMELEITPTPPSVPTAVLWRDLTERCYAPRESIGGFMARIHIKDLTQLCLARDPATARGGAGLLPVPIVVTSSDPLRTTSSLYTLLSFGPTGHGAFPESGHPISGSSTNCDEQSSAHAAASGTTLFDGVFILNPPQ
jgi:hypothetical protein